MQHLDEFKLQKKVTKYSRDLLLGHRSLQYFFFNFQLKFHCIFSKVSWTHHFGEYRQPTESWQLSKALLSLKPGQLAHLSADYSHLCHVSPWCLCKMSPRRRLRDDFPLLDSNSSLGKYTKVSACTMIWFLLRFKEVSTELIYYFLFFCTFNCFFHFICLHLQKKKKYVYVYIRPLKQTICIY